ncbi:MAG: mechanosensitive ion channel family protein [Acidobacteriota bacterium]|nr:mechanosensitive ion channel family protein [Acidobacteriota bacterium]
MAFAGFGASSLDLVARPRCRPDDLPAMSHNARLAIHDALNRAGIEIPFNQIVVHNANY